MASEVGVKIFKTECPDQDDLPLICDNRVNSLLISVTFIDTTWLP